MTDSWPYDADPGHPLCQFRVPVITTPYPQWNYAVALMVAERGNALWPSLEPDHTDTWKIVSYLEYRMQGFDEHWREHLRARPFDMDNFTIVLRKRPDGGWCYRRTSWRSGPDMFPEDGSVLTLNQVLDHVNNLQDRSWDRWKAGHPDIFGQGASGGGVALCRRR